MTSYFKHSTASWDPRDKTKLGMWLRLAADAPLPHSSTTSCLLLPLPPPPPPRFPLLTLLPPPLSQLLPPPPLPPLQLQSCTATASDTMKGLIEQATSDILNTVDWGANMQMVDEVNSTDNNGVYVPSLVAKNKLCH